MARALAPRAGDGRTGFGAWLRDRHDSGGEVVGFTAAKVGFSSDTFLVDVREDGTTGASF